MLKRTMIPLLLVVGLPTLLSGQTHDEHHSTTGEAAPAPAMEPGEGMKAGMMMGGMMTRMSSPKMLLELSEVLSLTPEQVADLETLQSEVSEPRASRMESAHGARERAAALLEKEAPDFSAYEKAMIEAETKVGRVRASMAVEAARARALLTPDQREKLQHHRNHMGPMMRQRQEGHSPSGGHGS